MARKMAQRRKKVRSRDQRATAGRTPVGDFEVFFRGKVLQQGSMLVIGFPTQGLVGSIAAGHLVESLKMENLGFVTGASLPPTVTANEGRALAPIRIYSSGVVCGPDRKCNQLLVVLSDLRPELEVMNPLGTALVDWAEGMGISLVVVVEGRSTETGGEESDAKVVAIANSAASEVLKTCKFPPATGELTGMGGAVLRAALGRAIPVLCLLPESHKEFPDGQAAAVLVKTMQPLVPALNLDPGPLMESAKRLEAVQRRNLEVHKESVDSIEGLYR